MRMVEFKLLDGKSSVFLAVDQIARVRIEDGKVLIEGGGVVTSIHGELLDVIEKLRKE